MILAAPLLIAAAAAELSAQPGADPDQSAGAVADHVPRLAAMALILLVGMPWFLERLAAYTRLLLGDFRRYLG